VDLSHSTTSLLECLLPVSLRDCDLALIRASDVENYHYCTKELPAVPVKRRVFTYMPVSTQTHVEIHVKRQFEEGGLVH